MIYALGEYFAKKLLMVMVCSALVGMLLVTGAWLIFYNTDEKPSNQPVQSSKLKVEEWTCLKAKAGECLKWEVKEVYRDDP